MPIIVQHSDEDDEEEDEIIKQHKKLPLPSVAFLQKEKCNNSNK